MNEDVQELDVNRPREQAKSLEDKDNVISTELESTDLGTVKKSSVKKLDKQDLFLPDAIITIVAGMSGTFFVTVDGEGKPKMVDSNKREIIPLSEISVGSSLHYKVKEESDTITTFPIEQIKLETKEKSAANAAEEIMAIRAKYAQGLLGKRVNDDRK